MAYDTTAHSSGPTQAHSQKNFQGGTKGEWDRKGSPAAPIGVDAQILTLVINILFA